MQNFFLYYEHFRNYSLLKHRGVGQNVLLFLFAFFSSFLSPQNTFKHILALPKAATNLNQFIAKDLFLLIYSFFFI